MSFSQSSLVGLKAPLLKDYASYSSDAKIDVFIDKLDSPTERKKEISKPLSFLSLPEDAHTTLIGLFLDGKDLFGMCLVSKRCLALYFTYLGSGLLKYVADANLTIVKELIQHTSPETILLKRPFFDALFDRKFKNISPWQLAAYYGDSETLDHLKDALPSFMYPEALQQLRNVRNGKHQEPYQSLLETYHDNRNPTVRHAVNRVELDNLIQLARNEAEIFSEDFKNEVKNHQYQSSILLLCWFDSYSLFSPNRKKSVEIRQKIENQYKALLHTNRTNTLFHKPKLNRTLLLGAKFSLALVCIGIWAYFFEVLSELILNNNTDEKKLKLLISLMSQVFFFWAYLGADYFYNIESSEQQLFYYDRLSLRLFFQHNHDELNRQITELEEALKNEPGDDRDRNNSNDPDAATTFRVSTKR